MDGLSAGAKAAGKLLAVPAALWMAATAHAQSNACDSLKEKLAARIESGGVRGYSLDISPASTPLPSGAKVIGTCDGGAFRLVYRRFAAARDAAATQVPPTEPAPTLKAKKIEPPPAPPPPPAAPPAATRPAVREVAMPKPAITEPASSPSLSPPPAPTVPAAITTSASSVVAAQAMPEPISRAAQAGEATPAVQAPSWTARVSDFWAAYWPWIGAALLVPLAVLLWAWYAYNRDYDAAGLPRGPKL